MIVNDRPTSGQQRAGNYKKAHVVFDGLNIAIENPANSVRSGVDKYGVAWTTVMADNYGYLKNVRGRDKDQLDIFLNPSPVHGSPVFIIDQRRNDDGLFDEHKVMLGYPTKEEATAAYQRNYDATWMGLGEITTISLDEFKQITASGSLTMPLAMKKRIIMNRTKIAKLKKNLRKGCGVDEKKKQVVKEADVMAGINETAGKCRDLFFEMKGYIKALKAMSKG